MSTRAAPFDSLRIDDVGDVPINPFNLADSVKRIEQFYRDMLDTSGVMPITIGGDHTGTLPILRALASKHGPVGLVFLDAHADINDTQFGERITHGTHVRRAHEEGLLDANRVVQIGVRGTGYTAQDFDWSRDRGFRVVAAEDCWFHSLAPLVDEVRAMVGQGPVYLSFDIDVAMYCGGPTRRSWRAPRTSRC
jgi:guanidinobutyrase